jgi:hypothetical protein
MISTIMAVLMHREGGERYLLFSEHLIGRSVRCQLRIDHPLVSSAHAQLCWRGTGWELHDLDSRNGTFVDGRRLAPNERLTITAGAALAFGAPWNVFELIDDTPPMARAVSKDGTIQEAQHRHLLALPHPDVPALTIFEHHGRWLLEDKDGGRRPVADGEELAIDGEAWTLHLPVIVDPTQRNDQVRLLLRDLALRFTVNPNEEHIRLVLVHPAGNVELTPRVHTEVLLRLAEARDEDRRRGVAEDEAGWLYMPDLLARLCIPDDAIGRNLLYQHIYQARQQLAHAGVVDAVEVFQRRNTIATEGARRMNQIRIGTGRIEVEHAGRDDGPRGDGSSSGRAGRDTRRDGTALTAQHRCS